MLCACGTPKQGCASCALGASRAMRSREGGSKILSPTPFHSSHSSRLLFASSTHAKRYFSAIVSILSPFCSCNKVLLYLSLSFSDCFSGICRGRSHFIHRWFPLLTSMIGGSLSFSLSLHVICFLAPMREFEFRSNATLSPPLHVEASIFPFLSHRTLDHNHNTSA